MPLLCTEAPPRPAYLELTSIGDIYRRFEQLFLSGDAMIKSQCGHSIKCFDHHFFHLVGINEKWSMLAEKEYILATVWDFGKFTLRDNGSRAKNLVAALETFQSPDEVWEDNPDSNAKWVYVKEYDHRHYQFSIAFVTPETEGGNLLVPTSSFPCDKNRLKKWRRMKRVYP